MSPELVIFVISGVILVGGLATTWLLHEASRAVDPGSARIEAVKTGLSIAAATGGLFALFLAGRRQWHQEVTGVDANADAIERRITELYTKAADQLGADKAPVRLAGLYALERLADANPPHRQTIVDVICGYLRMPYTTVPARSGQDQDVEGELSATREMQVRRTAQRILSEHLRPFRDKHHEVVNEKFWPNIDLDLAGATLIDFELTHGAVRRAYFNNCLFVGETWFTGTHFIDRAIFNLANFAKYASFADATFGAPARFAHTRFGGRAWFGEAEFKEFAHFEKATFECGIEMDKATFRGNVTFYGATFEGRAGFARVHFDREVQFRGATFNGSASFSGARLTADASFEDAHLKCTSDVSIWPEGWGTDAAQPDSDRVPLRHV
jgi:hypothetical protein